MKPFRTGWAQGLAGRRGYHAYWDASELTAPGFENERADHYATHTRYLVTWIRIRLEITSKLSILFSLPLYVCRHYPLCPLRPTCIMKNFRQVTKVFVSKVNNEDVRTQGGGKRINRGVPYWACGPNNNAAVERKAEINDTEKGYNRLQIQCVFARGVRGTWLGLFWRKNNSYQPPANVSFFPSTHPHLLTHAHTYSDSVRTELVDENLNACCKTVKSVLQFVISPYSSL